MGNSIRRSEIIDGSLLLGSLYDLIDFLLGAVDEKNRTGVRICHIHMADTV